MTTVQQLIGIRLEMCRNQSFGIVSILGRKQESAIHFNEMYLQKLKIHLQAQKNIRQMLVRFGLHFSTRQIAKTLDCPVKYQTRDNTCISKHHMSFYTNSYTA